MVTTKWAHYKEQSFASNYFIFWEFSFQFKNLLQRVDLLNQQPKCPYLYFLVFHLTVLFSCEYPLEKKLNLRE